MLEDRTMLSQNDPYRDVEDLFSRFSNRTTPGYLVMPLDAYRRGDSVWVHVDLPGIALDDVDVNIERNVLTISAERSAAGLDGDQTYLAERPRGSYRRQVHLGEGLDAGRIEAHFADGVLTLRIPVAEAAKPRKIRVGSRQPSIT